METTDVKKTFWRDAAKYGGLLGLLVACIAIINAIAGPGRSNTLFSIVELVLFVWMMFKFLRLRGAKYGTAGFSYGQCMGFVMAMMLFAGLILGAANALIHSVIRPELMDQALEIAMERNPQLYDMPGVEDSMEMTLAIMKNPVIQFIGGIIGMIFYGGIIGLIVSAFAKRNPDVFADANGNTDGNGTL